MKTYCVMAIAFCLVSALLFSGCGKKQPVATTTVRVGWQTAWASQGQVMQSLIHTNIADLYGAKLTYNDFMFGPDLNEAATTRNIDVTNAGIVPVVNLIAADDDWIIVGRQVDFLLAIVARNGAGIKKPADLKGKKFGVPIAGGSHPYAIQTIKANGLSIGTGKNQVNVINLKPSEMALAIKQGSVDAVACWDPTTTLCIDAGGTIIDTKRYVGFITVRKSFAQANPDAVVNMLKAFVEAYYYAAAHHAQSDEWFAKVSGIKQPMLKRLKVIEPNLSATKIEAVEIRVKDDDIKFTQQVADTMKDLKLIKKPVDIDAHTDMSYADKALAEMKKSGYQTTQVKVMEQ